MLSVSSCLANCNTKGHELTIDPNLQNKNSAFVWYDARQIGVQGKGWQQTDKYYERLPARAEGAISDNVWKFSKHSAGLCVRFATNSKNIAARWTLTSSQLAMPHMCSIGVSGLDLYVKVENNWQVIGVGEPSGYPSNERVLARDIESGNHEYILYLPLYNGIDSLEIGVDPNTAISKTTRPQLKPIVIYGSSIVQGACASRPGMAHTNILSRRLDREVINLGFSGGAKIEPGMADMLAELDPAVYVIDPVPNIEAGMIPERFEYFVSKIRQAHPDTPLIFCESYRWPKMLSTSKSEFDTNMEFRKFHQQLKTQGLKNTYYISSKDFPGTDGADLGHPTDCGFTRMANILEPVLKQALCSE